jgi:hypothetical protein
MNNRQQPTYVLHLRPLPGIDGIRALRAALKILERRFGLRVVKRELKATGRPTASEKGGTVLPLPKDGYPRLAARLAKRRPDLAEKVRGGTGETRLNP